MPSRPTIFDYYALIRHPSDERVLLVPGADGWTLPHFDTPSAHYWQDVEHINLALKRLLGLEVTTLRCVFTRTDRADNRVEGLYEMETQGKVTGSLARGRWAAPCDLAEIDLPTQSVRAALSDWLGEGAAEPLPPERPPWERRGWYAEAARWVEERLLEMGALPAGAPQQLRAWGRSFVMRAPTILGDFYFKALPAMFAHEPLLTFAMSSWLPGRVPDLVAVDNERHWMLMRDFGGVRLDKVRDVAVWENAFRQLADLQIDLASRTDDIMALGCPQRPFESMSAQFDALMDDTAALTLARNALAPGEVQQLRELGPGLKEMCERLSGHRIPASLDHGDLWPENIVATPDGFVFYDWSDSSISHPFFSMTLVCAQTGPELPPVPNAYQRVRNAYLEPWQGFEPMDRLMRAFDMAQVLGALHAALGYYTCILPNMHDKWEMESMLFYFLRLVLRNAAFVA